MKESHTEIGGHRRLVRNCVSIATSRLCVERFRNRLRAIILTGSMARHEATIAQEHGLWRVLGDAEFLLVFHENVPLPREEEITALSRAIEQELLLQQVMCPVSISPAKPAYLHTLPPHIFGYELRECGRVVWGEASILSLIPQFSSADIPLEDGWRLLSNRIVEHIEAARNSSINSATVPSALQHQTIKLCLDTATSILLFAGAYAPSYSQRQQSLSSLFDKGQPNGILAFLPKSFAHEVKVCTDWKIGTESNDQEMSWEFWESVVSTACAVWRWELAVLTGLAPHSDYRELRQKSLSAQSAQEKIRGWALVFRETGWFCSWRHWPRWTGQIFLGSPRRLVYLAAYELFSRLQSLMGNATDSTEVDWMDVSSGLPFARRTAPDACNPDWRQLASDIAWNYHAFVEKTRA